MKIIVCLDDNNGMLFNKRRQSSDEAVRQRIIELVSKNKLLMNEYSYSKFSKITADISVNDSFLEVANNQDYCFVENVDILPFLKKIDAVVIYRWNRKYPCDFYFPISVLENAKMISSHSFCGKSHEKITEEIYEIC